MKLQDVVNLIRNNNGFFYVYILFRPNGIPFYIGKGIFNRICSHELEAKNINKIGCNTHKCNIIRKIWNQNQQVNYEIVEFTPYEERAFDLEMELIAFYGRINNKTGILSNLTDGGEGPTGFIFSDESLAKLSLATKGKNNPMYGKRGELAPWWGKKHTDEYKKKMSELHKGKKKSDATKKKISDAKIGISNGPHSDETKIKISQSNKGKHPSDETKIKISQSLVGRKLSPEHAAKARIAGIGHHVSNEIKLLMSELKMGNKNPMYGDHTPKSEEHRKNISKALKGKRKSEEHRRKLSENKKKYYQSLTKEQRHEIYTSK